MLLVYRLKAQLRSTNEVLRSRDSEIEILKRSMKSTKLEETEVELKTVYKEAQRLRTMFEQA